MSEATTQKPPFIFVVFLIRILVSNYHRLQSLRQSKKSNGKSELNDGDDLFGGGALRLIIDFSRFASRRNLKKIIKKI